MRKYGVVYWTDVIDAGSFILSTTSIIAKFFLGIKHGFPTTKFSLVTPFYFLYLRIHLFPQTNTSCRKLELNFLGIYGYYIIIGSSWYSTLCNVFYCGQYMGTVSFSFFFAITFLTFIIQFSCQLSIPELFVNITLLVCLLQFAFKWFISNRLRAY